MIGAGAAGLMAAITASRLGASVVLIDGTPDGGRKILISGGGRCNILPSVAQPGRYVTDSSPNTLRKILRSWPLAEQRSFFETELGMALTLEEDTGKLFPESQRARDVRDTLVARARDSGVRTWFGTRALNVEPTADGGWTVALEGAPPLEARAVILATGGLSVPATGSDGFGLSIAERLGHVIIPTYPALTPLVADPNPHAGLAGISLTVTLRTPGARPSFRTTDGLLFTHHGWSGPAVLDASHIATREDADAEAPRLLVQWTPLDADAWNVALEAQRGRSIRGVLAQHMPKRLADQLCSEVGVDPDGRFANLTRRTRRSLVDALTAYALPWTGNEGYKKAEVTGGGVALSDVEPRTLESRRTPGLYLCGEMLDAFGPIGGHNFLWAWATGRSAGAGAASG